MSNPKIELLRSLPFLEEAGPEVLARLAEAAIERSFEPGQIIFEEGSTGSDLYLIVHGRVEVVKGDGLAAMAIAIRGPGDLVGEMGFIESKPRFATLRALEPTRLLELPAQAMRSLLAEAPQALLWTMQLLSSRLRQADLRLIADLQRKNQELARAYRELQEAQAALLAKERLERELELARELQQSILPHEFPNLPGLQCAARNRPARQVGGDFYDVIPLGGDQVGLVMADTSDKGMAAALFMALTRSLIRAEARRSFSPQQVLLNVHRLLLEISQADMFVTIFYGVLDLSRGRLQYTRAGHDRPLHVRPGSGECWFLQGDGMFLGFVDPVTLEEVSLGLEAGDLLVLYTDGLTDANSIEGERFGLERLQHTICDAATGSPQDLCDSVFRRVEQFQAGGEQFDDMALLVARIGATG